jgi:hypothetical protein
MISAKIKNHNIDVGRYIFITIVMIYISLLIFLAYKINLSEDETYTLNTTSNSLEGVILQSYNYENQPPSYFLLLKFWRIINSGIIFARFLSVVLIFVAIYYFNKVICLVSGEKRIRWLTVLFMLNPFIIWAALEIRLYALLILLSISAIYYFFTYWILNQRKHLYVLLIISLIGLYTQFFFIFLIGSFAFLFYFRKGWKKSVILLFYLLVILVLWLPNLFFIKQMIEMQESNFLILTREYKLSIFYISLKGLIFDDLSLFLNVWIVRIIKTICLFIFIYACYLYFKNPKDIKTSNYPRLNDIFILLLFSISQFFLFSITSDITLSTKYLAIISPLIILSFSVFKYLPRYKSVLAFSMFLIYNFLYLGFYYWHPVKSYDYKSIANFVMNEERYNEPLLFYRAGILLPFREYYSGKNSMIPLPKAVRFDTSYLIHIKDTLEIKQEIEKIKGSPKSFIFISDLTEFEYKLNMNRKLVDEYFGNKYKISLDTLVFGFTKEGPLRIRRLEINN